MDTNGYIQIEITKKSQNNTPQRLTKIIPRKTPHLESCFATKKPLLIDFSSHFANAKKDLSYSPPRFAQHKPKLYLLKFYSTRESNNSVVSSNPHSRIRSISPFQSENQKKPFKLPRLPSSFLKLSLSPKLKNLKFFKNQIKPN